MKKAECRRIDTFELWCWRRLLRVPWTARRSTHGPLPQYSSPRPLSSILSRFSLSLIHKCLGDSGKEGHGTRSCSNLICWLNPPRAAVSSLVAFPQLPLPSVPSFPHLLSIPEHLSLVANLCLHIPLWPPFSIMPQTSVFPSGSIPNPLG